MNRIRLGLALALAIATVAGLAIAARAGTGEPLPTESFSNHVAQLRALPGYRGGALLQLTAERRSSRALLVPAVQASSGAPLEPGYHVRLSRRSCTSILGDPRPLRVVGPPITPSGLTVPALDLNLLGIRDMRRVESAVLLARGADGKFEPAACGRVTGIKLQDVLVSSGLAPPAQPDSVLIALLVPFKGAAERGGVHVTSRGGRASALAVYSGLAADQQYQLRLSRRTCSQLEGDPDRPLFVGEPFGGLKADGNEVAIESLELQYEGFRALERARSVAFMTTGTEGGYIIKACGSAELAELPGLSRQNPLETVSRLEPVGNSGVSGISFAHERPGRLRVDTALSCELPATCTSLMEEEGIFYFTRTPCGRRAGRALTFPIEPNASAQTGDGKLLGNLLTTAVRSTDDLITLRSRSLRVLHDGRDVACGQVHVDAGRGDDDA